MYYLLYVVNFHAVTLIFQTVHKYKLKYFLIQL